MVGAAISPHAPGTPQVALLVDSAQAFDRAIVRGVVRYARLHGPWRFLVERDTTTRATPESIAALIRRGATGVVARISDPAVADAALASGLPLVGLDASQTIPAVEGRFASLREVSSDSAAGAAMAVEHLVERGHRHIAFVGEPGRLGSQRCEAAVRERAAALGCSIEVYPAHPPGTDTGGDPSPERDRAGLATWVATLRRPAGVVACHDARGRDVLDAAVAAGVAVPDGVAVIGIGNDDLLCDVADPPLSSVAFNTEVGGFRLAELLDRTMRREIVEPWRIAIEPTRVVARRSTEVSAVADADVAAAMHYIHLHATEKIGVDDIVEPLCVSRRALELRFREAIGRTLYGELQRVRVERAKRLLIESDLPIPRVAEGAGFSSGAYLAQVFRKSVGMTPVEFRRRKRD